jgi:hypothetical protein
MGLAYLNFNVCVCNNLFSSTEHVSETTDIINSGRLENLRVSVRHRTSTVALDNLCFSVDGSK